MTDWTDKRIAQLQELRELLYEIKTLDHGSGFIARLQKCEKLAESLSKLDLRNNHNSFILFLEGLIVAEWDKEKKEGKP